MDWKLVLVVIGPALAIWNTLRDRPRLAIKMRGGKASEFASQGADGPNVDVLAIRCTNLGRRPFRLAPHDPLRLVVAEDLTRLSFALPAGSAASTTRPLGPALPIPDTTRHTDAFYGRLTYCVGHPAGGQLGAGGAFTVLVSRPAWQLLGSGTAARCVAVRVLDHAGRVRTSMALPPALARWFNDEPAFVTIQAARPYASGRRSR